MRMHSRHIRAAYIIVWECWETLHEMKAHLCYDVQLPISNDASHFQYVAGIDIQAYSTQAKNQSSLLAQKFKQVEQWLLTCHLHCKVRKAKAMELPPSLSPPSLPPSLSHLHVHPHQPLTLIISSTFIHDLPPPRLIKSNTLTAHAHIRFGPLK